MTNSVNIAMCFLYLKFQVRLFEAKNRMFKFDYQEINTFEFVWCFKNDVQFSSTFSSHHIRKHWKNAWTIGYVCHNEEEMSNIWGGYVDEINGNWILVSHFIRHQPMLPHFACTQNVRRCPRWRGCYFIDMIFLLFIWKKGQIMMNVKVANS